jgi:hypothetical protein
VAILDAPRVVGLLSSCIAPVVVVFDIRCDLRFLGLAPDARGSENKLGYYAAEESRYSGTI